LLKVLYGLKQAGRQWKARLNKVMKVLGFKASQANDCLYVLQEKGTVVLLVLVYVDDMAVTSKSINQIQKFKLDISKEFDITDIGELNYILGIQVVRNHDQSTISMNQTAYILRVLAHFGMQDCAAILPHSLLSTICQFCNHQAQRRRVRLISSTLMAYST
jgi:virulence-associated protein VapD